MRVDFSESPCKTTTQLPFTIIHHAGTADHEHIPSSHQKPSILRGKSSNGGPAPSIFTRLWLRTKYGQGYVKLHNGTTTYWQKKSRDGLALSEGTTQHEGYRGNILNRGQLKQDLRGPHHPFFFCVNCPEKCYYEVKCLPGCLVLGAKIIKWRLRTHV